MNALRKAAENAADYIRRNGFGHDQEERIAEIEAALASPGMLDATKIEAICAAHRVGLNGNDGSYTVGTDEHVAWWHGRSVAPQPPSGGEPVAWMVTAGDGYERHVILPEAEAKRIHGELVDNGWQDATLVPLYAAPPSAPVGVERVDGWQHLAADWLEQQAEEQEATNAEYPKHAAAYFEWRYRPVFLRLLAEKVKKAEGSIKRHCPPPSWMFPDDPLALAQQPAPVAPVEAEKALGVLEQAAKGGSITNTQLVWSGDVDKALLAVRQALAAQQPAQSAPAGATITNPWTGEPRDYRDVNSDPEGVLCVEPGAPLKAAPGLEGFDEWYASYDGVGGPKNPEKLARDAWERAAAIAQQPAAVDGAMVERALAEWRRLEGHQPDAVRMRAALSAPQPPTEAQANWEEAPPGATHYQPHQGTYYKRVSASEWHVWSRREARELLRWMPSPGTSDSAEWVVRPAEVQDKWKALIGKWQQRAEAAGYDGIEGALEAAEAQAQGGREVRAKRIEWKEYSPGQWDDNEFGFHIRRYDEEPAEDRFEAAWGEGDPARFPTLAEAQAWCQQEATDLLHQWMDTTPPSAPVGVEGFDEWFDEYTKNNYTDEMLALAAWKQALAQQPAAVDGAMVERALAEWRRLEGHQPDAVRMRAALTAALDQPGGSDNDR